MRFCSWTLAVLLLTAASLGAESGWPGFRGPTSNGVAPAGDYPVRWSATENVVWKATLPGLGSSTPVVTPTQIFLTCAKAGRNTLVCYGRDGSFQWDVSFGGEKPGKNKKASGANPSPCTDGERVYAYFKSGDLAAVDLTGKVVWQTNLQERFGQDDLWWDLGTSPMRTARHLVVAVMQTANSYVVAFDPQSGEVAWKVDRNLGAPEEAGQAYSTPVAVMHEGQERLVVLGGDHVTCHAATDGKELWRVGGLNPTNNGYFRSISGPAVCDGIVIAPYGRGDTVTGVKLGGQGDVTKSHVAWHLHDAGADVPTPVAVNGRFYVLRDKGKAIVCREVATGAQVWATELRTRKGFSSSPVLAGGRLYCTDEDGVTFVVSAETGAIEAQNNLGGELTVATPVCVDGQIFLRTAEHLYCLGAKR